MFSMATLRLLQTSELRLASAVQQKEEEEEEENNNPVLQPISVPPSDT